MTRLSQPQREALIELLCLAAATNHRESPAQEIALHRALKKLGWADAHQPQAFFLARALNEAREIIGDEKCTVAFLATRAAEFDTDAARKSAMDLLMMVLEIDGMEECEDTFVARVLATFNE
jgi:hypothetical protein